VTKKVVFLVVILASAGCSHHAARVVSPDGDPAYALRCSTMSACYEAAGDNCPNGYERLDQMTSRETRSGLINSSTATKTDWLIRCK
jgi:hypothetical protein